MERPDDCPDPSGNGGGCDALHRHVEEQGRFMRRLGAVEVSIGTMRVDVVATKEIAARAEMHAARAAESSAAVHAVICAPINDIIAKYQSAPPPELLDADDGENIPTATAIQVPWMSARKIRREQLRATEAERRAEALGAEKERMRAAAEVETKRVAEAARIKQEQDDREKRNSKLIASAIATAGMIATAIGTYFAARGH
jgi:hypothetical protein